MILVHRRRLRVSASSVARRTAGKRNLRQTEVENLGVAALGDKDVGGLDVAVNDAFGVGRVEGVGNLDGQRQNSSVSSGRPAMRCFSVTPSRNSMAMKAWPSLLADFVDGADVGMVQCGGGLGFALKTAESLGVLGYFVGQKLESDEAAEFGVLGLVDHTHPAAAELLDDAVVRDGLADHRVTP